MRELDRLKRKDTAAPSGNPVENGKAVLFRPGIQIRFATAILIVIFSAFLPLVVLYEYLYLLIPFEIFLTLPLLYGLFVMARRAADGEEVLIYHLFAAFSRRYVPALLTVTVFLLLSLLPLLLPASAGYGIYLLSEWIKSTSFAVFSKLTLFLGIGFAVILVFPAMLLQSFSYLYVSYRVKYTRKSRPRKRPAGLLLRNMPTYLAVRMRFLLLGLASALSVGALFPLYTIPLYFCTNATLLDLLIERSAAPEPIQQNNSL